MSAIVCIPSLCKEAMTVTRLPLNIALFLTSAVMVVAVDLSEAFCGGRDSLPCSPSADGDTTTA